jgi:hypothetical protein
MDELEVVLRERGIADPVIRAAIGSGYVMKGWVDPFSGRTWTTVSDRMYGSKQCSSSFDVDAFAKYLAGEPVFERLPPFVALTVKNREDVQSVLEDERRQRYIADGSLSFRGQTRNYFFRRTVPNPRRADATGVELSVMPGLYRQDAATYSFAAALLRQRSFEGVLHELEPRNPNVYGDASSSHDITRVEQHYANPTMGLDLCFDIDTALFFATHRFVSRHDGIAAYERVETGHHEGVVYCFRFGSPTVKKTEYLIREFDLLQTFVPERVLRQRCGLPMIGDWERNVASCDLDCIIRLDPKFETAGLPTPEYMFPSAREDQFYEQLLELKRRFPKELSGVVEYAWARS